MSGSGKGIVGFGFDSCYLDFRFCLTAYKRVIDCGGLTKIWRYSFSSLSHGVGFAEIEISLVMGLPVSWAAFSAPTGSKEATLVGSRLVATSESIESIQMQAANCIYGPGPLSQAVCNALSQCDEEHRKMNNPKKEQVVS